MPSSDPADALTRLLARLRKQHKPEELVVHPVDTPEGTPPLCEQFVFSMLLWESTTAQALNGIKKLREAFADLNELRVAFPDELAGVLGERYPRVAERCERMHEALNAIFVRAHDLSLEGIANMPKRDARAYIDAIDGVPSFVAARWALVALGTHAVPTDGRLVMFLRGNDALPEDVDADGACSWLERHIRASDAMESHLLLQAGSDQSRRTSVRKAPRARRATPGAS